MEREKLLAEIADEVCNFDRRFDTAREVAEGLLDRLDALGLCVVEKALPSAAGALLADVRRRYPGEELRCEFMRALDAATTSAPIS